MQPNQDGCIRCTFSQYEFVQFSRAYDVEYSFSMLSHMTSYYHQWIEHQKDIRLQIKKNPNKKLFLKVRILPTDSLVLKLMLSSVRTRLKEGETEPYFQYSVSYMISIFIL